MATKRQAMTTKKQIERLAAKLNVEVSFNTDFDIDAVSPRGFLFATSGCHSLVASAWDNDSAADVRQMMMDDLRGGLVKCDYSNCEHCGSAA
jgi:hypothetical protein